MRPWQQKKRRQPEEGRWREKLSSQEDLEESRPRPGKARGTNQPVLAQ